MRFISISLFLFFSPSILCQSRTVDASIIRKGLLVRVSCDLHSYPVALPAPFPERKRIPSDYTGSGGCALIYIFPYVTYVYVHTPVVPPTLLSDIAIIRAYRNAPPARKLSNAVASFCSVLRPIHCEIINDNVVIISRGRGVEMLAERSTDRSTAGSERRWWFGREFPNRSPPEA